MKKIIKYSIYILILSLILHKLYIRQINTEGRIVEVYTLITEVPFNCIFESGDISFQLPDCESYEPGKVLNITGRLSSGFSRDGQYSDNGFFKKKGLIIESISDEEGIRVSPELWLRYLFYIFDLLRKSLLEGVLPLLGNEEAHLIGELSLGSSYIESKKLDHLFKITGTQYLVSISGYHLSLVIRMFSGLVKKFFDKKLFGIIIFVISSIYFLLIGYRIPLVRAYFMLVLSLVSSSFLMRQNRSIFSLFLTALILFLTDISIISSVSFQLSFVATASIILFSNKFGSGFLSSMHLGNIFENNIFGKNYHISTLFKNILNYIFDSIKISLYVQIGLLPLVIYHFGEFSIISVVVSIFLTWLIPGIIILSFFFILLSLPGLNQIFLRILILPLDFLAKIFLRLIELFDYDFFIIKIDNFAWWSVLIWWLVVAIIYKIYFRKKPTFSLVGSLANL